LVVNQERGGWTSLRRRGCVGQSAGIGFYCLAERWANFYSQKRYHGSSVGSHFRRQALTARAEENLGSGASSYSRAFENFVGADTDDEDVVGLVAYALFKKAVREESAAGLAPPSDKRNPSPTTVKTYRAAAEQHITGIVAKAIEEATPEIQQSAALTAIEATRIQIENHVTTRTGFGPALVANIAAWALTLFLAVTILFLSARPAVEDVVLEALDTENFGSKKNTPWSEA
jgi:hypothetical protein